MNYVSIQNLNICLEGVDRLGKSYCANKLADYLKAKLVIQPSKSNNVSFLRDIIKQSQDLTPFERQLLCAFSHVEEFHKTINNNTENLVYDRSHLSTLIYSKIDGVLDNKIELLKKLFKNTLGQSGENYNTHIFVFDRESPFGSSDSSYQEQNLSWTKVRDEYRNWYNYDPDYIFSPYEHRHLIQIGDKSKDEVFEVVVQTLKGGIS